MTSRKANYAKVFVPLVALTLLAIFTFFIRPDSGSLKLSSQASCLPLTGNPTVTTVFKYADDCGAKSPDDVVPLLPVEWRRNFTFAYFSRSPEAESVDPLHPRLVIFSDDATRILGLTTKPGDTNFQKILAIEFVPEKNGFEFSEKDYNPRKPTTSTAQDCRQCHGTIPHPIWDSYSVWRGFYGQYDDQLRPEIGNPFNGQRLRETEIYKEFLASIDKAKQKNRLQRLTSLEWPEDNDHVPPYSFQNKSENYRVRPNVRLTSALDKLRAQRLFEVMKGNGTFSKELIFLFAYKAQCFAIDPDYRILPHLFHLGSTEIELLNAEIQEMREQDRARGLTARIYSGPLGFVRQFSFSQHTDYLGGYLKFDTKFLEYGKVSDPDAMAYVQQDIDLYSPDRYNETEKKYYQQKAIPRGLTNSDFNDGSGSGKNTSEWIQFFSQQYIAELAGLDIPESETLSWNGASKDYCSDLATLFNTAPRLVIKKTEPTLPSELRSEITRSSLLNVNCSACHHAASQHYIDFAHPKKLKTQLLQKASTSDLTLLAETRRRILSQDPSYHMPRGHVFDPDLADQLTKELNQLFKK